MLATHCPSPRAVAVSLGFLTLASCGGTSADSSSSSSSSHTSTAGTETTPAETTAPTSLDSSEGPPDPGTSTGNAGSESSTSGSELPDDCPAPGPAFAYVGNGSVGPYPSNTVDQDGSPTIVFNDGAPDLDESQWIAGNGDWANGTFDTLAALTAGIGDGGGWALIPGTELTPELPTNEELGAIYGEWATHIRGTTGPTALLQIWGGGAWDGQSFVMGAAGGHFSYWGNEMYRVRLTDPPAAVRMHDSAPLEAIVCSAEECPPGELRSIDLQYGPRASHTYDSWRYSTVTRTFFWSGSSHTHLFFDDANVGQHLPYLSEFDPRAATPKAAHRRWYLPSGQEPVDRSMDAAKLKPDQVTYVGFNINTQAAAVIDLCTKEWRAPEGDDANGMQYPAGWGPGCRYDAGDRYFSLTSADGIFSFDECTAGFTHVYSPLPAWVSAEVDYIDGGAGMQIVGNLAVMWGATAEVAAVDIDTGAYLAFVPDGGAAPTREAGYNGVFGRWAWLPEVGVFVGYGNLDEGAWLFKPPIAWGLPTAS